MDRAAIYLYVSLDLKSWDYTQPAYTFCSNKSASSYMAFSVILRVTEWPKIMALTLQHDLLVMVMDIWSTLVELIN